MCRGQWLKINWLCKHPLFYPLSFRKEKEKSCVHLMIFKNVCVKVTIYWGHYTPGRKENIHFSKNKSFRCFCFCFCFKISSKSLLL